MCGDELKPGFQHPKVGELALHSHAFLGPYLAEIGFSLVNDPREVYNPCAATRAIYS